jgi:serine protease Do
MKIRFAIYTGGLLGAALLMNGAQLVFAAPAAEIFPVTSSAMAPVAATGAVQGALAIQNAFTQVSRAVEPAVVTITTWRGRSGTRPNGNEPGTGGGHGFGDRPDRRNFNNNSLETPSTFEAYLQQFQRNYGFAPNKSQRQKLREKFEAGSKGGALQEVQQARPSGLGSGLIFREDGYIMTNAHVVEGARMVAVRMTDGREFGEAQVVGVDERSDVAVIKVNARNLPVVQLGDSSQVQVGDWAIAIGNPFGLEHTMTVGVISAKAREMPFERDGGGDYLQTDASINPGNSGGPLCDINGRAIGINNAIYSESGGNVGIGFAIPINTAKAIAEQLVNSGKVTRSYLGVTIATLNNQVADEYKVDPALRGVLIADVGADSPAQRAGLAKGDVVRGVNGQTVAKSSELQRAIELLPAGSTVQMDIVRAGKPLKIGVQVDALK